MPIALAVNGVKFEVPCSVDPTLSLHEYLRVNTPFKGSKLGCGEGGCGACAVEITRVDCTTGKTTVHSINSCLCPVGALDGAAITTAEGLGNSLAGFHPVQERLAGFHGSQCGFCTPGMVVACHATLTACKARGQAPTDAVMEKGLDGNICRCTGYRSIMDACKTFSGHDIEDLGINVFGAGPLPSSTDMEAPAFPPGFADYAKKQATGGGRRLDQAGRVWHSPRSLPEVFAAVGEARGAGLPFRVLCGNTGAGVYKNWPDEPVVISLARVAELRAVSKVQGGLRIGGAVSLGELVELLGGADGRGADAQSNIAAHVSRIAVIFKHLRGSGKGSEASPAAQMAAHIARIAGQHVRGAATVGGNLALARNRRLESDLAPLLLAAGARVTLASADGLREVSMEEVLDEGSGSMELGTRDIVASVMLPAARSGDVFWSHRISHRYSNSAAMINAAFNFNLDSAGKTIKEARVVYGLPGMDGWQTKRCGGVEAALTDAALAPHTLVAALEALPADTQPEPTKQEFVDAAAQGILLEALAPLVQQASSEADGRSLAALLAARRFAAPEVVSGYQDFSPPDPATTPVGLPVEKDRAKLQASGEAIYTSDIVMPPSGLYGVFVESTEALAELQGVDPAPALALPGVAAYIDVRDIPKGGANLLNTCGTDVIFADQRVEYVGQRIGMVLADSQSLAEKAAKLVRVHYVKPASLGKPVLTIQQAIQADSFYDLSGIDADNCVRRLGDATGTLPKCTHKIMGGCFSSPSQQHMYMEPQAAVAMPDEGGAMLVHSSTQCIDMIQTGVAAALNLTYNQVIARVRRVGGGFGGKTSRSIPPAAAAAVAAHRLRRPVRVVLNRNADLRMIGGRNEMDAEFDVGFDDEGRFEALHLRVWILGGAQEEISGFEAQILTDSADQNYAIPHLTVESRLVRCNLPPRTIMRGPGTMQAVLLIEHIVDRVAAYLGVDPCLVRERNLLTHPKLEVARRPCAGTPAFPSGDHLGANENRKAHEEPQAPASNGAANGVAHTTAADIAAGYPVGKGVSDEVVLTALRSEIPLDQFTVPRLWYELKDACHYDARYAEILEFNKSNVWRKRGISMTTCRFTMTVGAKPATVHIYHDGTVLLLCPGHEIGQGLFTKVRQSAAMALSEALPPAQRPFPIQLINVADNASDLLPNAGPSWGSTTSEASTEAVRLACRQLVATLKPHFAEAGENATWQEVIMKVHPDVGFNASKVLLTATAYYDGTQRHMKGAAPLEYYGYGSAASEVEVDVLTGEVRVRQGDIMVDAGHSLNPAVDIGQAEGGYVQGLGMMLSEDVKVDLATGKLLSDSTWTYKVPSADTIPRKMNVHLLKNSPHARGILSSKAVGEPPLLLSVSALSAVQMAVNAARADLAARGARQLTAKLPGGDAVDRLRAPATPARVKAAIGSFNISELLRAAT